MAKGTRLAKYQVDLALERAREVLGINMISNRSLGSDYRSLRLEKETVGSSAPSYKSVFKDYIKEHGKLPPTRPAKDVLKTFTSHPYAKINAAFQLDAELKKATAAWKAARAKDAKSLEVRTALYNEFETKIVLGSVSEASELLKNLPKLLSEALKTSPRKAKRAK